MKKESWKGKRGVWAEIVSEEEGTGYPEEKDRKRNSYK